MLRLLTLVLLPASFALALGRKGVSSDSSLGLKDYSPPELQEQDDPCRPRPIEDALVWAGNIADNHTAIRLSLFEPCFASIRIDKQNMLEHIYNLKLVFEQYYAFYNIAKDPGDSVPNSYQPELGYSIFGEGEGQVDLGGRLDQIAARIEASNDTTTTTTTSASVFWEIQEAFNLMRDAHVNVPSFAWSTGWHVKVIPSRSFGPQHSDDPNGFFQSKYEFTFNDNGMLEMKIKWLAPNGTETEDDVDSIDGKSVHEFFLGLNESPALNNPYMSKGARMNNLLGSLIIPAIPYVGYESVLWWVYTPPSRPSDIFPDTFQVTFASGEEETMYSGATSAEVFAAIFRDTNGNIGINRTHLEELFNQPGADFLNFQRAVGRIVNETVSETSDRSRIDEDEPRTRRLEEGNDQFYFDEVISVPDAETGELIKAAAFKMEAEYAVLKVEGFSVDPEDIVPMWVNMTIAAKEKGIKKVLVDISSNGGGNTLSGFSLVVAMFPFISYEWFVNLWDNTFNEPMRVYHEDVLPLVQGIQNVVAKNVTDADLQTLLDLLDNQDMDMLKVVTDTLLQFCENNCNIEGAYLDCDDLIQLQQRVNDFIQSPSPPQLLTVLEQLQVVLINFTPFLMNTNVNISRSVIRGGTEYNLAPKFTYFQQELYESVARTSLQTGYSFDDFVILSNGVSGSTTAYFESMVSGMWKNKDSTGAHSRVVSCSYGGLGTESYGDATATSFPASAGSVNIANPLITSGGLFLLERLLPSNISSLFGLANATNAYNEVLAVPPYFAMDLPRMPVTNYYDPWMGSGALPLQYVKRPPDEYIKRLFLHVTINDSADLAELYSEASKFFAQTPPSPTLSPTMGGLRASALDSPVFPTTPPTSSVSQASQIGVFASPFLSLLIAVHSFIILI